MNKKFSRLGLATVLSFASLAACTRNSSPDLREQRGYELELLKDSVLQDRLTEGSELLEREKYDRAISHLYPLTRSLERVRPNSPGLADAYGLLGEAYAHAGQDALAIYTLQKGLPLLASMGGQLTKQYAIAMRTYGSVLLRQRRYLEASDALEKSLPALEYSLGPEDPLLLTGLHDFGALKLQLGDATAAEDHLQRALQLSDVVALADEPVKIRMTLARAQIKLGKYQDAKENLQKSIHDLSEGGQASDTDIRDAQVDLARAQWKSGKADDAEKNLVQILEEIGEAGTELDQPTYHRALHAMAEMKMEHKKFTEASELYEKLSRDISTRNEPGSRQRLVDALEGLGSALVKSGNHLEAEKSFRRAVALASAWHRSPETDLQLARLTSKRALTLNALRRFDAAGAIAKQSLARLDKLKNADPLLRARTHLQLGVAHLCRDRLPEARAEFEAARDRVSKDHPLHAAISQNLKLKDCSSLN